MEYQQVDGQVDNLKKRVFILAGTTILFFITTIIFLITTITKKCDSCPKCPNGRWDKIPEESIIPTTKEIAVDGKIWEGSAAEYNRTVDFKQSPYYPILNFYDGNVSSTLKILPKFKTYQQSVSYSCGVASAFMALRYLGIDSVTEDLLFKEAKTNPDSGTGTLELADAIKKLYSDKVKVEYKEDNSDISIEDYGKLIKECVDVKNKCVLVLENVEWGGHWMTLIGYDDMGTDDTGDDVLVFADPYDSSDHNQDGYYVVSFERYYDAWFDAHYLDKDHNLKQYVKITALE